MANMSGLISLRFVYCGLFLFPLVATSASAFQEKSQEKASPPKVETIAENLHLPFAVTVRPRKSEVFVAESGAGKVLRIINGVPQDCIRGFAVGEVVRKTGARETKFKCGPASLHFINDKYLVVGTAGQKDFGKDALHIFKIAAASEKYQEVSNSLSSKSVPERRSEVAEGQFFDLVHSDNYLFTIGRGNEKAGWLIRASLKDEGKFSTIRRFTEINKVAETINPTAIAMSPRGELVVASSGKSTESTDTVVSFFSMTSRKCILLQNFKVDLPDIISIRYSPAGDLYVLAFNWQNPTEGGLYKLVSGETGMECKARQIVKLHGPTAMAFDASGNLFITVTNGLGSKKGQLLKVTGLR